MEVMIILLSILPFVLALCSLWVVWWRNEQIAPTDASKLQMFLAIFWAAASAYLFCPALYSTLATASHHPEYNPHINEIRGFLDGWLSVLPPAALLPGVLALQNRWHAGCAVCVHGHACHYFYHGDEYGRTVDIAAAAVIMGLVGNIV